MLLHSCLRVPWYWLGRVSRRGVASEKLGLAWQRRSSSSGRRRYPRFTTQRHKQTAPTLPATHPLHDRPEAADCPLLTPRTSRCALVSAIARHTARLNPDATWAGAPPTPTCTDEPRNPAHAHHDGGHTQL
jgi:hypothetical protein